MKIEKWKTLSSEVVLTAKVFRYKRIKTQSPTTLETTDFDIVECFNWINIIAITPENEIVLVRQYRHGLDEVTLEIPGGAAKFDEDHLLTAKRELEEETGFTSKTWEKLITLDVNPAFMTNVCETYVALDAVKTSEQCLDPFEEIEVVTKSLESVPELIKKGEISHSLMVAALATYFLIQRP